MFFLEHSVYRKLNKIDPCFDAIAVVQIRLRIDMYGALEMYLYCIVLYITMEHLGKKLAPLILLPHYDRCSSNALLGQKPPSF